MMQAALEAISKQLVRPQAAGDDALGALEMLSELDWALETVRSIHAIVLEWRAPPVADGIPDCPTNETAPVAAVPQSNGTIEPDWEADSWSLSGSDDDGKNEETKPPIDNKDTGDNAAPYEPPLRTRIPDVRTVHGSYTVHVKSVPDPLTKARDATAACSQASKAAAVKQARQKHKLAQAAQKATLEQQLIEKDRAAARRRDEAKTRPNPSPKNHNHSKAPKRPMSSRARITDSARAERVKVVNGQSHRLDKLAVSEKTKFKQSIVASLTNASKPQTRREALTNEGHQPGKTVCDSEELNDQSVVEAGCNGEELDYEQRSKLQHLEFEQNVKQMEREQEAEGRKAAAKARQRLREAKIKKEQKERLARQNAGTYGKRMW